MEVANSTYDNSAEKPFQRLKKNRGKSTAQNLENEAEKSNGYGVAELEHEIRAARKKRKKEEGESSSSLS